MQKKEKLLLLPGLLCDAGLWQQQSKDLAGLADIKIPEMSHNGDITEQAKLILDSAPERFALAGFSMGGYCALEIIRLAPERVIRLALLDTSARPDSSEQTARRLNMIALNQKSGLPQIIEHLLPLFVHPAQLPNLSLLNDMRAMANRVGPESFVSQQRMIMSRNDQRPQLKSIVCPTLVLCGRQDAVTPLQVHQELAEGITSSNLVVINQCGHFSPMEQPEQVSNAMQSWLLDE